MFHTNARKPNCSVCKSILCKISNSGSTLLSSTTVRMDEHILGQAWLVNDLVLGVVAMLYTWFVYPWCEKMLAHVPARAMNVIAIVVVVGFIVLCIVKFS